MGVLNLLKRGGKRFADTFTKKVTKYDDAAASKTKAAEDLGYDKPQEVPLDEYTAWLNKQADIEVAKAGERATVRSVRNIGVLGLAGVLGGGGALAYAEGQDTKQAQEQTRQYNEYQDQLRRYDDQLERGEITQSEYEAKVEAARDDYRRTQGDETAGISMMEVLANMSTAQLAVVGAVSAIALWVVGPPIVKAIDNFDLGGFLTSL